jgi:transcriptional regulator with XRE-family HTH domain
MNDARAILGINLRRQREARRMSLRQFADVLGKDHAYLHRVESGLLNVSLTTLDDLARALEMHPWQLLLAERRLQESER